MKYSIDIDSRLKLPDEIASKHWNLPVYMTFSGEVNDENSRRFVEGLTEVENAAKQSRQEVIPIIINSNGGSVYACLEMIDAIKNCSLKIATVLEGKAFSAGAILFSCGAEGYRYMAPNATLMIHPVSLHSIGKLDIVKASTKEGDRLNEKIFKIMAANCGKPANFFIEKLKKEHVNSDWYLDVKEALKVGLANHGFIPSFKVKVDMKYDFS